MKLNRVVVATDFPDVSLVALEAAFNLDLGSNAILWLWFPLFVGPDGDRCLTPRADVERATPWVQTVPAAVQPSGAECSA